MEASDLGNYEWGKVGPPISISDTEEGVVYMRVNGTAPFFVSYNGYSHIGEYRSGRYNLPPSIKVMKAVIKGENEMAKKNDLYQVKGTDQFCRYLAKNSAGMWVMEMLGTGEVKSYPETSLEEVLPYTVDVNFHGSTSRYTFESAVGEVEVGDVIIRTDDEELTLMKVVEVDTKKNPPNLKRLRGIKLTGSKIGY